MRISSRSQPFLVRMCSNSDKSGGENGHPTCDRVESAVSGTSEGAGNEEGTSGDVGKQKRESKSMGGGLDEKEMSQMESEIQDELQLHLNQECKFWLSIISNFQCIWKTFYSFSIKYVIINFL